jgi:Xaa-Pro aminopeptidase
MNDFIKFKIDRIRAVMDRNDLDLLIASLPENVYYMSNYQSVSRKIISRVDVFCLYCRDKDEFSLVLPCSEGPTAFEQLQNFRIYGYGNFFFTVPDDPAHEHIRDFLTKSSSSSGLALIEAIKNSGLKKGNIALDDSRVRPSLWEEIKGRFSGFNLVPASDLFGWIRMIKHDEEIALIERAAEIAEQALFAALSKIRIGTSEAEIGQYYMNEVTARGGMPFFNVATADLRSAYVDTINTQNTVNKGSLLRLDVGCIYEAYRSDMARTAVMGTPSEKVESYYRAILQGEEEAIEHIGPGVSARKIFEVAVEGVRRDLPHFRRHHCGHGIGLEGYDPPSIAPTAEESLEPGMVLCIETPFYELGWGGVQVEDMVLVTPQGKRLLTKSSRELIRIDIEE